MKAKFINESLSIGPDGIPSGEFGIEIGDIMEVISNSAEKELTPEEFGGFINLFGEIPDIKIANEFLWELVQLHPYIIDDIKSDNGPYKDELDRFLTITGTNARRNSPFPPMSMN